MNDDLKIKVLSWHEKIRRLILIESNSDSDTTEKELNQADGSYSIKQFNGKRLLITKKYDAENRNKEEIHHSFDGKFELRLVFDKEGKLVSDNIFFENACFGVFNKYTSVNSYEEHGFVFNNIRFGVWEIIDSLGTQHQINYGMINFADSLANIHTDK